MKVFLQKLFLALFLVFGFLSLNAQPDLYDLSTIQKVEIKFTQTNWDYMLDTAKAGADGYILCEWVKINGYQYDSAGVKYKGSSSYDPSYVKNPFNISLDEFKGQTYNGIKTLKLANCYSDPSMIREVLAYNLLGNYMDCPRSNFAQLYINGNYIGLYSNDESVNKKFCSTHFNSSKNTFIKCSPEVTGPQSRSSLQFVSNDSSLYFGKYELESDYGWNDLVELTNIVSNQPEQLSTVFDMDRLTWMLAFNSLIVNLDSYNGWFSQNYYIYKDNFNRYNPVVWDLNMSFGGFPFVGTQGGGSGSLTIANMKNLSPLTHSSDTDWPLIRNILADSYYRKVYFAHLRTMLQEQIASNAYQTLATQLQAIVDTAVLSDTNKFFTYTNFTSGLITDVNVGTYTIPGITNLMEARASYLASFAELTAEAPSIASVTASNTAPVVGQTITLTATINNAAEAYLNYRFGVFGPFIRLQMYDDGAHNDGLANDLVYGVSIAMDQLSLSYYISALNQQAAMLAPERAEHEFYTLEAHLINALPGEITINEFLAKNDNENVNELGSHEDWLELKNNTDHDIDLYGLYLSDDFETRAKFAFIEGSVILSGGYLPIWADEESSTTTYIHCGFKLSAGGDELMLSDGAGTIIDSLTFGAQTADVSMGRCPNGTGEFVAQNAPSFAAANTCGEGIEYDEIDLLTLVPNPSTGLVQLAQLPVGSATIEVLNVMGARMLQQRIYTSELSLQLGALPKGLYAVIVRNSGSKPLAYTKLLLVK
jgi:hypothetical protein